MKKFNKSRYIDSLDLIQGPVLHKPRSGHTIRIWPFDWTLDQVQGINVSAFLILKLLTKRHWALDQTIFMLCEWSK